MLYLIMMHEMMLTINKDMINYLVLKILLLK